MWLDDQGIAHEGEPPQDHQVLGGRYYPVSSHAAGSIESIAGIERSNERELLPIY